MSNLRSSTVSARRTLLRITLVRCLCTDAASAAAAAATPSGQHVHMRREALEPEDTLMGSWEAELLSDADNLSEYHSQLLEGDGHAHTTGLKPTSATNVTLVDPLSMPLPQEPTPRWRGLAALAVATGILAVGFSRGMSSALAMSCVLSVVYIAISVSIDLTISYQKSDKEGDVGQYPFNPLCAVVITELVKLFASLMIYLLTLLQRTFVPDSGDDATASSQDFSTSDIMWLLIPALFMTINNILVFKAIGSNDAAVFGVFRDTMILWTAGLWRFVFHTPLGQVRMVGIATVLVGLLLNRLAQKLSGSLWSWTFLWVMLMTVMNATGSVANEFALKRSPKLDINLQNGVLYISSAIFGSIVLLLDQPERLAGWTSFFEGFGRATFLMISLQAGAGLLVSRLLKYTDAVTKTMATCLRGPVLVILAPYVVTSSQSVPVIISAFVVASGAFVYLSQGPLSVKKV